MGNSPLSSLVLSAIFLGMSIPCLCSLGLGTTCCVVPCERSTWNLSLRTFRKAIHDGLHQASGYKSQGRRSWNDSVWNYRRPAINMRQSHSLEPHEYAWTRPRQSADFTLALWLLHREVTFR
jgi:hypothetical protein